jgi:hypothetical protein
MAYSVEYEGTGAGRNMERATVYFKVICRYLLRATEEMTRKTCQDWQFLAESETGTSETRVRCDTAELTRSAM